MIRTKPAFASIFPASVLNDLDTRETHRSSCATMSLFALAKLAFALYKGG